LGPKNEILVSYGDAHPRLNDMLPAA